MRWADEQIDRAALRTTLTYRFHRRVRAGLEYNPRADDLGPIGNVLAVAESRRRPALIFGTSSDRIGTIRGQAYYGTLSKDLSPLIGVPVAPYFGASFGTFDDKLRPIGGLDVRLAPGISSTIIHDGVNVHPTFNVELGRRFVGSLLLVDAEDVGISVSVRF